MQTDSALYPDVQCSYLFSIDYGPPPHLEYAYPPPNGRIHNKKLLCALGTKIQFQLLAAHGLELNLCDQYALIS